MKHLQAERYVQPVPEWQERLTLMFEWAKELRSSEPAPVGGDDTAHETLH